MATIKQYAAEFERQLKLRNNRATTISTYTGILTVFLSKLYKDPRSITVRMVEDYLHTSIQTMQNIFAIADERITSSIQLPSPRPQLRAQA